MASIPSSSTRSKVARRLAAVAVATGALALPFAGLANAEPGKDNGRPSASISVYVSGQGLVYDSIVVTELPMQGPFQKLIPSSIDGADVETEFGPGDQDFVGGRWWVDVNGDNEMNEGDMFFLCPLLGPGHAPVPA